MALRSVLLSIYLAMVSSAAAWAQSNFPDFSVEEAQLVWETLDRDRRSTETLLAALQDSSIRTSLKSVLRIDSEVLDRIGVGGLYLTRGYVESEPPPPLNREHASQIADCVMSAARIRSAMLSQKDWPPNSRERLRSEIEMYLTIKKKIGPNGANLVTSK